ncbi:MAG: DUF3311 domain-containing protein [Thermaerobacter sp.]|nr:DUF3311 domain-containing protein [Thermaerobacter sp.]
MQSSDRGKGYWLLIVPFVATLWPPFYARTNPVVGGFPFMYWYLLIWTLLVGVLSAIVYRLNHPKH